jgi:hypothetical protein
LVQRNKKQGEKEMAKFGQGVSNAQATLARKFEAAGLTSYSQAIKAFQRGEESRINEWKRQLQAKQEVK